MITLQNNNGRLGNHFFRALMSNYIAEKTDICIKYYDDFSSFGLKLNRGDISSSTGISGTIYLPEDYFNKEQDYTLLKGKHIHLQANYCQTPFTSRLFLKYLNDNRQNIMFSNPYKERYNQNNDVFVHVRLDDVIDKNPGLEYYKIVLNSITFNRGYISSDSINHPICKNLISTFNLEAVILDEKHTIQFASTCKYIVLSNGTFSWMIGALGFFSKVWYPKVRKIWHGEIFDKAVWTEVDI